MAIQVSGPADDVVAPTDALPILGLGSRRFNAYLVRAQQPLLVDSALVPPTAVVRPDDLDYEQTRKVWKAAINHHPAVIVRCAAAQDAAQAIRFAQNQGLELAVRSGAHSAPGHSSVDGGLVIDLSRVNQVTEDPEAKRAWVQAGALLRDLNAATQRYGLAVPAGVVGHTGVTDLTLGGGMGWLTRCSGLSIDNLVSAEVAVADGKILRAAEDENPDLFWAIRGGGGNFGVVTELVFRLHAVDPVVQFACCSGTHAKANRPCG
jgi:FAD/FMN-containing dehydrogenase